MRFKVYGARIDNGQEVIYETDALSEERARADASGQGIAVEKVEALHDVVEYNSPLNNARKGTTTSGSSRSNAASSPSLMQVICSILCIIFLIAGSVATFSSIDGPAYPAGYRFKDDNAYGAAANALERMVAHPNLTQGLLCIVIGVMFGGCATLHRIARQLSASRVESR